MRLRRLQLIVDRAFGNATEMPTVDQSETMGTFVSNHAGQPIRPGWAFRPDATADG
jgi:hypothetical protein